jgi:hypothetical protein
LRGYVLVADMSRIGRIRNLLPEDIHVLSERESEVASFGTSIMLAKRKPVAFIYNTDELSDKIALINLGRPPGVPFLVLGQTDDDQLLVEFFGG